MNPKLIRIGLALAATSLLSLTMSIFAMSAVASKETVKVVRVKEAIVLTDRQRINLLIDELLTPKSAKCFRQILINESHINPKAKSKTSSAKGVGQLLAGTYRNLGLKHSNDGMAQTVASLAYIGRKYGASGPCGAWRFWKQNRWY